MHKILVVEDVDTLREVLCSVLQSQGFDAVGVSNPTAAFNALLGDTYDGVLSDFKLREGSGIELLERMRSEGINTPFILMTAYGSVEIAVEAMKAGATDFLAKPFEPMTLTSSLRQVLAQRRIGERGVGTRSALRRTFVTKNARTQKVLKQAEKVARVDSSVLIMGESGTGKELFARLIHEQSPRCAAPFVAVNCAAIPTELLESELFGHEAGAFTGATQTRLGLFELASGGTIFLDEIGDMSPQLQVKLLRTLQEKEIKRIGGSKVIPFDSRVIAATNIDVEAALQSKALREDLYYRVAIVNLTIPPLRERPEDVEFLAYRFAESFSVHFGKEVSISREAIEILKRYRWPGNTRELENLIERAVILCNGATITPEHLGLELGLDLDVMTESASTLQEVAGQAARRAELAAISKALAQTGGNKSQAARLLGVSYKTLLSKVREFRLEDHRSAAGEEELEADVTMR
jgi:two-component system, NtrC family, response regulator AtoC